MDTVLFKPKNFNSSGLNGISESTMKMHLGLYQDYVKNTILLTEQLVEMEEKQGGLAFTPAFLELKKHMEFEYGGLSLHELYFNQLTPGGLGEPSEAFLNGIEKSFGNFKIWKSEFTAIGNMRGVGWAGLYQDPETGNFSNHWVTLNHQGAPYDLNPILVLDMWEHAYFLDYKPTEKNKYIEAFFSNLNWEQVNEEVSSR